MTHEIDYLPSREPLVVKLPKFHPGGTVTATTSSPHGLTLGDSLLLTISGASPSGHNGTYLCTPTGASTFT